MPTPHGRLVYKDFVQFFMQDNMKLNILLSQSPDNVDLWERLFELRFGEMPKPGPNGSENFRHGSTDPRWETLLHKEKALRIVGNLRAIWLRRRGG